MKTPTFIEPIVNAIGDISITEALDAIDREFATLPEVMPDSHLMTVAEQQIDWIAEKFDDSRAAGRLALLSVLLHVRDTMLKLPT